MGSTNRRRNTRRNRRKKEGKEKENREEKDQKRRSRVKMANFGVFLRIVLLFFFMQSYVEPKHFLVKTEDSPGGLDGPSDSGDYAASVNRQGGQGAKKTSQKNGKISNNHISMNKKENGEDYKDYDQDANPDDGKRVRK